MASQGKPRHWLFPLLRTRTLAAALVLAAIASFIATYISITRRSGLLAPDARGIVALILANLILLFGLAAIVVRRAVRLWASFKEGSVGSRMQTRIVVMFTMITIVPTVVVSVFSAWFFNFGIQSWFDERVSTALEESVAVAQAYLNEHKDIIRGDAIAMAGDLDREIDGGILTPARFNRIVNAQAALRSLTEAIVRQHGHILAQTQLTFSLAFEQLPADIIERADHGEVVVLLEDQDKVRALVKLKSLPDAYLLVGRLIDPKVLAHMDSANGSVQQYRRLKSNIFGIQVQFSIVFVLLALLLLFGAVLYGMHFSTRLIGPITKLVKAAERVRAGDFAARVPEGPKDDEVGTLARAFNRMTDELEKQRKDLIEANRQLDTRRRFSEAVLSGVSAGIMAVSRDRRVTLVNPVAAALLLLPQDTAQKGQLITEAVPEFTSLLALTEEKSGTQAADNITLIRRGKTYVLRVRVVVESTMDGIEGYIVTFDDITELLVAQRSAVWSDVARRVAHEIKNPLTPITLAAERLRKKYLPQITSDAENYVKYVDTISKHVGDIGKIVEEFVTFARMPAPVMKREDITALLRKAVFSEQTAHPDISYQMRLPERPLYLLCDEQQVSRVLLNLLKNAAEAFESLEGHAGAIMAECAVDGDHCLVRLMDNGPGFPRDMMHRLLEPYMTTRAKGTGLGLAIVKKIIDDHKAQLVLENLPDGGACVTLIFSIDSGKNVT
jgi:two-component system nitrogen regulation sensor histidine kinase NtrY